jgi:hypothetical protein
MIGSIPQKFNPLVIALAMTVAVSICILSPGLSGVILRFWPDGAVISTTAKAGGEILQPAETIPGSIQWPFAANGLLQFTSAGHVLGFREKEIFIAAGDHALKVKFVGARATFPHAQGNPLMLASSQQGGRALGKVTYHDMWDGVTVVYEGVPGAVVKSTYYIAPRTTNVGHTSSPVDQIRLRYNVPVRLDDKGNLVMSFETGEICESAPVAWQEVQGNRIPVEAAYCLFGEKEVGFRAGKHDPAVPLVIDPKLVWNTFMGSSGYDCWHSGIAVDLSGNVYVSGDSSATWGTPVNPHAGGASDAFVAKLNNSGGRIWHTFMGSAGTDYGGEIAVDASGNIYVIGFGNDTWGIPVRAHSGGNDAFAAKLDSSGALLWNTFMGSGGTDQGFGIALDSGGNVYVSGFSAATWGTPVNSHSGGTDAFAAKLNSSGVLLWNSFMGSGGNDESWKIAVDGSGNVYVAGFSAGTWGTPVNGYAGGNDAFVAKLNSSGVSQWHTFMGSGGTDYAAGLTLDGRGYVYVAGYSDGTWGTPVNGHAGGMDAFGAKLNGNTGSRMWHTFMGSAMSDQCLGVAVDGGGNVYLLGLSWATWGTPLKAYVGTDDAFVAKLNGNGALRWHTFMGSGGNEEGRAIVVDSLGFIYASGLSEATWGAPVNPHAGGYDVFVAKHTTSDIKAKMLYFSPVHNLKE